MSSHATDLSVYAKSSSYSSSSSSSKQWRDILHPAAYHNAWGRLFTKPSYFPRTFRIQGNMKVKGLIIFDRRRQCVMHRLQLISPLPDTSIRYLFCCLVIRKAIASLRCFGVAKGRISGFSIDLRRRPYNTLALLCECVPFWIDMIPGMHRYIILAQ